MERMQTFSFPSKNCFSILEDRRRGTLTPSGSSFSLSFSSSRFRVLYLLLLLLLGSAQLKYGRSRATLSAGQINVTKGQINAAASNEGEANSVGIN